MGFEDEHVTSYKVEDPDTAMPGVHPALSLRKRWLTGTLHYAVSGDHLDYYLDEFTVRFNRRNWRSTGYCSTDCCSKRSTPTHPLKDLIGGG